MDKRIINQYKVEQEIKNKDRRVLDRKNKIFEVSQQHKEIPDMKSALKKVRESNVTHNQEFLSSTGPSRNH